MNKSKQIIAVSKCLLGVNCKYSGGNNYCQAVVDFTADKIVVPVCPEEAGGLSTPRKPCEIVRSNGELRVVNSDGEDVTENFVRGAELCLAEAQNIGVTLAVLKSRSPSCGCGEIYDGTFSGTVVQGNGIAAQLFLDHGIEVVTENQCL